jgi:hypothetical protein
VFNTGVLLVLSIKCFDKIITDIPAAIGAAMDAHKKGTLIRGYLSRV